MIYVLGSINNDVSLELERIPKKGETIIADGCRMGLGGKGANQAVAIARLAMRGADKAHKAVKMIGLVGNDAVGTEMINKLDAANVDTEFVRQVNRATGTAIIALTGKDKDNRIIVYSGANLGLSKSDVDEALEHATSADTLLCQLEVPLYIVAYALRKAHAIGMTTVLNPAPAKELPDDFYYNVDLIVPNETETQILTGINPKDWDSQLAAMRVFHERGVRYVVLTLGANGAAISDNGKLISHIPACKTTVADTTAAGDTFVGALSLTYPHVGMYSFKEACLFATKASSITVSRRGAAESIPSFDEVCSLYSNVIK
ncbi:MAG: ribokinase [Clostridiales bacterium]|uniref:ribokinase n=1 Tax=Anaerocaecibacter muris TaxID=2941513 RepID=UPI00203BE9AA|nr:ribokinase [Anaerocaecibacter muris]MDE6966201.1 ribokinase [Clostridiales bacterium]